MLVPIATVAEFVERVRPAYLAVLQTPPGELAQLEVVLAPGEYRGANFSIGEPFNRRAIDVVVRGADPDHPPLLTDVSLSLTGDRVELAHLVFKRRVDRFPVLRATAGQSLTIDRCAFIENQVRQPPDGRLIEVVAANPHGATAVTLRQTWFLRNWATHGQVLLAGETEPPHHFDPLRFEQVAFLDNHASVGVAPHATVAVHFARCVVVQPARDAETPPVLVAVTSPGTQLTIDQSLVVTDDLAGLASRWSPRHPSASVYQPVMVSDSALALRRLPPAGREPDGIVLERTRLDPATPIDAQAEALAAVIDRWATEAERGAAPNLDAIRAVLLANR